MLQLSIIKDSQVSSGCGSLTVSEVFNLLCTNDILPMIPTLSKAIRMYAVIPATSCSAERSFSSLRRLKTYLRNTMSQDRLSSLAVLHIEREYVNRVLLKDMDRMIDVFGERSGRNVLFF